MTISRVQQLAIRAMMLGAFLASTAVNVAAQKQDGPPKVTKGTVKSNPKADKGQATAEAARVEARNRKAIKSSFKSARGEPKALLRGIRFSPMEKRLNAVITKRYAGDYKALEKAGKDADKAGTPDAGILAKIDAIRLLARSELRDAMTEQQRIRFESNRAGIDAKRS
jgi:hypothetical protein